MLALALALVASSTQAPAARRAELYGGDPTIPSSMHIDGDRAVSSGRESDDGGGGAHLQQLSEDSSEGGSRGANPVRVKLSGENLWNAAEKGLSNMQGYSKGGTSEEDAPAPTLAHLPSPAGEDAQAENSVDTLLDPVVRSEVDSEVASALRRMGGGVHAARVPHASSHGVSAKTHERARVDAAEKARRTEQVGQLHTDVSGMLSLMHKVREEASHISTEDSSSVREESAPSSMAAPAPRPAAPRQESDLEDPSAAVTGTVGSIGKEEAELLATLKQDADRVHGLTGA